MKLTDILPSQKWVELEEEVNNRFGLNACVFDKDGIRITDYKKWANSLCPVVKGNKRGQSFICSVANQNMITQAMQTRKRVIGECDAGLVKLVVPIFIGNEFLGVAGGCGLLFDNCDVDSFLISKITGIDEKQLQSLSNDIDKVTTGEAELLVEYIEEQIDNIVCDFESRQDNKL